MSKNTFVFKGTGYWITTKGKDFGDGKGEKFLMTFVPKDAAERKAVKGTGIKNKIKEGEGGKGVPEGELYYVFRASKPYAIVDLEGKPVTDMVGNGSTISIELEVENFTSAKFGDLARSELKTVVVEKLIPYVKEEPKGETKDVSDLPA